MHAVTAAVAVVVTVLLDREHAKGNLNAVLFNRVTVCTQHLLLWDFALKCNASPCRVLISNHHFQYRDGRDLGGMDRTCALQQTVRRRFIAET